jgi:hypothetical protein
VRTVITVKPVKWLAVLFELLPKEGIKMFISELANGFHNLCFIIKYRQIQIKTDLNKLEEDCSLD